VDEVVYEFDWDPAKAAANLAKHGVDFRHAATVFNDPLALTVFDAVHSQSEERWFTLGMTSDGRLVAVAHTFEQMTPVQARIRIISARQATRRERNDYQDSPR